jgi:hypothetical protein
MKCGIGQMSQLQPSGDGAYVVFVQSKLPLDETKLAANLPTFERSVRQARRAEAFNDWFRREAEKSFREVPYFQQQAQLSQGNYYQMLAAEREAQRQAIDNRRNAFTSALNLRALDDQDRARAENRMIAEREVARRERDTLLGLRQYAQQQAYNKERDRIGDTRADRTLAWHEANSRAVEERKRQDEAANNAYAYAQSAGDPSLIDQRFPEASMQSRLVAKAAAEEIARRNYVEPELKSRAAAETKNRFADLLRESEAFENLPPERKQEYAVSNWRKQMGADTLVPEREETGFLGLGGYAYRPSVNKRDATGSPVTEWSRNVADKEKAVSAFQAALVNRKRELEKEVAGIDSELKRSNSSIFLRQKPTGAYESAMELPDFIRRRVDGGAPGAANPPVGTAKPLTRERAIQFLDAAGGDKIKARALAAAAGYTF